MIQIQNFSLTHRTQGRGFSQGVCQGDFSSMAVALAGLDRLRDFPTTSGSDFDNGGGADRDDDQDSNDYHKDPDMK